jgi:hypothetical protein
MFVRMGTTTMKYENDDQKRTIQRWARLAIQLNGAVDTGSYAHLSVPIVIKEIQDGDIFGLLERELPTSVWEIAKLTDVDRHTLSKIWKPMAEHFEPRQHHVERNGLALLVAYLLNLIDHAHAVIPR